MYFKDLQCFIAADKILSPHLYNVLYLLRAFLAVLGKTGPDTEVLLQRLLF